MIVSSLGVAEQVVNTACESLDKEISELRARGRLDAGRASVEKLQWTPEAYKAAREFKEVE
jgi:hypothetical protein